MDDLCIWRFSFMISCNCELLIHGQILINLFEEGCSWLLWIPLKTFNIEQKCDARFSWCTLYTRTKVQGEYSLIAQSQQVIPLTFWRIVVAPIFNHECKMLSTKLSQCKSHNLSIPFGVSLSTINSTCDTFYRRFSHWPVHLFSRCCSFIHT